MNLPFEPFKSPLHYFRSEQLYYNAEVIFWYNLLFPTRIAGSFLFRTRCVLN